MGPTKHRTGPHRTAHRGKSYTAHPSVVSYATFNPCLQGVKATGIHDMRLLVHQLLLAQKPVLHTQNNAALHGALKNT